MSLSADDIRAVVAYRKEKAYATMKEVEDMINLIERLASLISL